MSKEVVYYFGVEKLNLFWGRVYCCKFCKLKMQYVIVLETWLLNLHYVFYLQLFN